MDGADVDDVRPDLHAHLIQVIQQLSCCNTAEQVVETIQSNARTLLQCDGISVVIRRGDEVRHVAEDAISKLWTGGSIPIDPCITGHCILNREPLIIADVDQDPRVLPALYRDTFVKSLAAIPIRPPDPVGALIAYWGHTHSASRSEMAVLSVLANGASVALESVRTVAEVEAARGTAERRTREVERWKQRWKTALRAGHHAFFEIDLSNGEVVWDGLDAMFDMPLQGKGSLDWWVEHVHPEDRSAFRDHLALVVKHGGTLDVDYRVGFHDQKYLTVLQRTQSTQAADHILSCFISDITKTRELEGRLRQAERLEALGRMASSIAHDFNNLLMPILAWSQLSLREEVSSTVREGLEATLVAGESARELVRRLLAFGRHPSTEMRQLDLNAALQRLTPVLRRSVRPDVEVQIELSPDECNVLADPIEFDQLVLNLTINAQDAMPHGGKLRISLEHSDGRSSAGEHEARVLLRVSDTGVGMDEALRARIFEPFFTTKEAGRGSGLGLSIVDGIVRRHGGELLCQSQPGQGTDFVICLPALPCSNAHSASYTRLLTVTTILVVDDDPQQLHLTQRALGREGYRVVAAHDGASAIQSALLLDSALDLVIGDDIWPGDPQGYFRRRLQALHPEAIWIDAVPPTRDAPGKPSHTRADLFLYKPFTLEALLAKVNEAMRQKSHLPVVEFGS